MYDDRAQVSRLQLSTGGASRSWLQQLDEVEKLRARLDSLSAGLNVCIN